MKTELRRFRHMHIAKPRTFHRNLNEKHVRFHNDVRSERERERRRERSDDTMDEVDQERCDSLNNDIC